MAGVIAAHAAIPLCSLTFESGALGLSMACGHDAGHAGACGLPESSGEVDGTPQLAPLRLLICGSSARGGATGWTDAAAIGNLLDAALPDVLIEGRSPSKGADYIAQAEGEKRGIEPDPCPMDPDIDGHTRGQFMARNSRMAREKRPNVGAAFISGKVGEAFSAGSAHMVGVLRAARVPLVIYREDGIELPTHRDGPLAAARDELKRLYRLAPEDVVPAGQAVALAESNALAKLALLAARNAVETLRLAQPRLAPWVAVVERLLR